MSSVGTALRLGQRWGAALGKTTAWKLTANDSTETERTRKTEHTRNTRDNGHDPAVLTFFTSLTCPGTTPLMRLSSQGKAGAGIYSRPPSARASTRPRTLPSHALGVTSACVRLVAPLVLRCRSLPTRDAVKAPSKPQRCWARTRGAWGCPFIINNTMSWDFIGTVPRPGTSLTLITGTSSLGINPCHGNLHPGLHMA